MSKRQRLRPVRKRPARTFSLSEQTTDLIDRTARELRISASAAVDILVQRATGAL